MTPDVAWGGRWECEACGASGQELFDDEATPDSGHDCDPDGGEVTWSGEWLCHDCGASGDDYWDDGNLVCADHDCTDELELEEAMA